jgi:hypothetical protein
MNPIIGRFMPTDPNEPGAIDPFGIPVDPKIPLKYLYADGTPTNRIDLTSRDTTEDTVGQ